MISIKTKAQLDIMRDAGNILAQTFEVLNEKFKPGVSAGFLDKLVYDFIISQGAIPSFLGYNGYKHSTCISKNEEVVHGIPYDDKLMLPGDICSIDIGVYFNGYHADAARIFVVPPIQKEIQHLVDVTTESFFRGIEFAKEGNHLSDISFGIQSYVEINGLTVVKDLYSHGIGTELHEDPLIPNYGKKGKGILLKEGMTFAIEPMVNIGKSNVLTLDDKWTIITTDKKWSAHFENTICVGKNGPEILTKVK